MYELLSSFSLVALAEIGDKTQLIAIVLAARYRRFWPVFAGVLAATLLNHAAAAYGGTLLAEYINGAWMHRGVAIVFLALGLWLLIPDKASDVSVSDQGAFLASLIAFFLAEMGDKTQLATIMLGAQYQNVWLVTLGTTLGMLAANVPAILFGESILSRIPLQWVRRIASVMFIAFGGWGLLQA